MRVTRKSKPAVASDNTATSIAGPELPPSSLNPPMVFILPQDRTQYARIASLPDPATGKESRYFFDPGLGLYEFTNISNPKNTPSSWLLASEAPSEGTNNVDGADDSTANGYTVEQPSLLLATPIDLSFMILPILLAGQEAGGRQLFLTMDDYLEKVSTQSRDLAEILGNLAMAARLEKHLTNICDKVEAGEDSMYRVNTEKLTKHLLSKAERMAINGLPASMEQRFVQEALQAPATLDGPVLAEASALVDSQEGDQETSPRSTSMELSQATSFSSTTSANADSQASQLSTTSSATAATSLADDTTIVGIESGPSKEIQHLLRLRTALNFILISYISPSNHAALKSVINDSKSGVDFAPLDAHLKHLETLRKEAQALRSLSDNISRKRRAEDDDEAEELRAEKKRKKEEEDAKKKAQSRAIKQLAKTDTSGMKKLSSFFTKGPAKKASG
ncbi:hypothetical protein K461DRAFT_292449 [Myriangium duriaei CBS 260.36]|uniref:Ribonuclease H2 subunit B n=1 Tax=Myriangium duriaei CBS 260.36 TaxID=1168546 RepID=A0A9P4ML16_9PEZI|nr:hypothetical protein K461DRAFT_292449 [Myriangium duriaei CBS 260.36]